MQEKLLNARLLLRCVRSEIGNVNLDWVKLRSNDGMLRCTVRKVDGDIFSLASALEGGMVPLFKNGLRKIRDGRTTTDEVMRAIGAEAYGA